MKTSPNQHITRPSDSSLYDEICTVCGATDAMGDTGLDKSCRGKVPKRHPNSDLARERNRLLGGLYFTVAYINNINPATVPKHHLLTLKSVGTMVQVVIKQWDKHYIKKTYESVSDENR